MMSARRILAVLLLAVVPPAVAQQAPRKAVKSASDLPAFSYPVTGDPIDLIRSEEAFRSIAEKLRRDIESLLRDYSIEDRPTLSGLHRTLLTLDLLENQTEQARKEIALIRDLEDKPAAKLMSGLIEGALLDSGGMKSGPQEFLRRLSAALNPLPWDVVGDQVKDLKARTETLSESMFESAAMMPNGPAKGETRQVGLPRAQNLALMRFLLRITLPLKSQLAEALGL